MFVVLNPDVIRDNHVLKTEAQVLSTTLLQQAYSVQGTPTDSIFLEFSREGLILLATLLYQMADNLNKQQTEKS